MYCSAATVARIVLILLFSSIPSCSLRAQQHLNGTVLVHRTVALHHLVKRQDQVEDLAGVDLLIPDEIDQFGQVTAYRDWAAVEVDVGEE